MINFKNKVLQAQLGNYRLTLTYFVKLYYMASMKIYFQEMLYIHIGPYNK